MKIDVFPPRKGDKDEFLTYITLTSQSISSKAAPLGAAFLMSGLTILGQIARMALTVKEFTQGSHLTPLEEHITQLVSPIIDELGFELVRLRITGARRKTLQIMAERPDGTMTAKNCASLSRAISPMLEEEDPIDGAFSLEVSSPGIDRPLTRTKDFVRWEGFDAKLELDRIIEGRKKFRGVLAGFEDGNVALDIEGEDETALFPLEWIVGAKLLLTDDLVRESLRAAQQAGANVGEDETTIDEEIEGEASNLRRDPTYDVTKETAK